MRQVQHALVRQASVKETQFDFVRDPDNATWRTHLGMYRRTCSIRPYNHKTSNGDSTSTSTDNTVHSVEVTDSSDQLSEDCEGYNNKHLCNQVQEDCGSEGFRKFSAPAVLSRQLSCGSNRSTHTSVSPYYPFPQLKCPKKSEAARRLGLYSSFWQIGLNAKTKRQGLCNIAFQLLHLQYWFPCCNKVVTAVNSVCLHSPKWLKLSNHRNVLIPVFMSDLDVYFLSIL